MLVVNLEKENCVERNAVPNHELIEQAERGEASIIPLYDNVISKEKRKSKGNKAGKQEEVR